MKTDTLNKYILVFCYAFFSFAISIPSYEIDLIGWIKILSISAALNIFFLLIISGKDISAKILNIVILLYLAIILIKQIIMMNNYMKMYHRGASVYTNIIISAAVIVMIYSIDNKRLYKLALPFIAVLFALIFMVFVLNYKKFNLSSIYLNTASYISVNHCVTLFDYCIPLYILSGKYNKEKSTNAYIYILFFTISCILLTVFVNGCIHGNLLYSLSPLQAAFQISGTLQMKNYDALFNLMLCFLYFSSLIVIFSAYKKTKECFEYSYIFDISVITAALFLFNFITDKVLFWIQIFIIFSIFFGGINVKRDKKN